MKKRDPAERQQHLLAINSELRESLATQAQGLKKPLALVDKALAAAQWVSCNPVLPLGVGLLLAVALPKRTMLIWGGRLWGVWAGYNRVRNAVVPKPRKP